MRCCSRCHIEKPLADFYSDKKGKNGLQAQCKECTKLRMMHWYDHNREIVIQKVTERAQANPSSRTKYNTRKRAETPPEVQYARAKVNREVLAGRLFRPTICAQCGITPKKIVGHHHNGYDSDHMLDVIWLCTPCHLRAHGMVRSRVVVRRP